MGCCDKSEESSSNNGGEGSSDEDKKFGEPVKYDPTFNGPIKNRSCTDILCCLLFIICFLAMLCVAFWAYIFGDPKTLLYPSDSDGNLCGEGDFALRPNVFFFDLMECAKVGPAIITSGCPTPQICVEHCPSQDWTWISQYVEESANPSAISKREDVLICKYHVDPGNTTTQSLQDLVIAEECAAYYLESEALVGRCVPALLTQLAEFVYDGNGTTIVDRFGGAINGTILDDSSWLTYMLNVQSYGSQILSDLGDSWAQLLVMMAISAVVSFIWILLMRWIAGPIIWITLFLFLGLFSFGTYYCFDKYVYLTNPSSNATQIDTITDLEFTTDLNYWANLTYTWLTLGIIAAVMLFIVLVVLIFLRKRILIAIELIGESSRAVGNMMFTLLWPIWPFLMEVVLFAFWGASALYLASVGAPKYGLSATNMTNTTSTITVNGTTFEQEVQTTLVDALSVVCDPNGNGTSGQVCSFIAYGGDEYTIYLQFFMLFMWFWMMNFIIALGQMTLAGAFASYYWAFDKSKDIPTFPILGSLWRCFRYHLGSLAFGSLIIAIIQLIRVILEYLDMKLKGGDNKCVKFLLCCLKCFFWCLEKFMKFINKNAYILIAVYGKNFCSSAKNAFFLIMRNIVRVVVIDKVTDFLLFIGKLVVVAAVGALAFFFFSGDLARSIPWESISVYVAAYSPTLNFYLVPVIVTIIGSYVIAAAFFSVYSMAVDTLFLCFLEDLERHDGSADKPYYMSKGLMKILGKKNKKPEGENGGKKK